MRADSPPCYCMLLYVMACVPVRIHALLAIDKLGAGFPLRMQADAVVPHSALVIFFGGVLVCTL